MTAKHVLDLLDRKCRPNQKQAQTKQKGLNWRQGKRCTITNQVLHSFSLCTQQKPDAHPGDASQDCHCTAAHCGRLENCATGDLRHEHTEMRISMVRHSVRLLCTPLTIINFWHILTMFSWSVGSSMSSRFSYCRLCIAGQRAQVPRMAMLSLVYQVGTKN